MEKLSHDLRLMVLERLADIRSLASLIFVSNRWYESFRSRVQWTLGSVLYTELGATTFNKAIDYYHVANSIRTAVSTSHTDDPRQFLEDAVSRRKKGSDWRFYLCEPNQIDFEVMAEIHSAIITLIKPTMNIWEIAKRKDDPYYAYEMVFPCGREFEAIMGERKHAPEWKELYALYYLWLTLWFLEEDMEVLRVEEDDEEDYEFSDDEDESDPATSCESDAGSILDMENISERTLETAREIISIDHGISNLVRDRERKDILQNLFQLRHLWRMIPSDGFDLSIEAPFQRSRGIFDRCETRPLWHLNQFGDGLYLNEPERRLMDRLKSKKLARRFRGLRDTMSESCFMLISLRLYSEDYHSYLNEEFGYY